MCLLFIKWNLILWSSFIYEQIKSIAAIKSEIINPTWAGFFLKSQGFGGEGGASRPAVKKHAVFQKIFVHFT